MQTISFYKGYNLYAEVDYDYYPFRGTEPHDAIVKS